MYKKDSSLNCYINGLFNCNIKNRERVSIREFENFSKKKDLNLVMNPKESLCPCIKNTDELLDLLEIVENIDMDKRTCNRMECKRNVEFKDGSEFFVLNGWSRYPIKLNFFEKEKVKNWDLSYHGTTYEAIKNIIKDKRLIIPNNKTVHIRQGHIPNQFFIFTSPSLTYASFGLYSAPFKLKQSNKWWQIVVELVQRPNSYVKEWETSGLGMYKFDENIGNDELEWKSDQETGNLIKAVLIREIGNIEPPICQYPIGTYFLHEKTWWYQPYDGNTPFCPNEICSSCICCLQRGARADGTICPLSNLQNISRFQNNSLCTIMRNISQSNSLKIVGTYKIKNIKLNNTEEKLVYNLPIEINHNLEFRNRIII